MERNTDTEDLMIRYLLGDLPEAEQTRLEERLFADDDYFEQLSAIEDELIDEYVRGELAGRRREQFERSFLAVPRWRQRVEFARTLLRTVSAMATEKPPEPVVAHREAAPGWRSWPSRPALPFALAAMALVAISAVAWLVVERRQLHMQLAQLQADRQTWQQREHALQQRMAEERERGDGLIEQLRREQSERTRLERALAAPPPSRPTALSFVLSSVARDPGQAKRLVIPVGAPSAQLQIDLEEGDDHKSYRAVLHTTDGNEIWSQDGLRARRTDWGKAVVLRVLAHLLTPGDYELALRGVAASGEVQDIGYYYFNVMRRPR